MTAFCSEHYPRKENGEPQEVEKNSLTSVGFEFILNFPAVTSPFSSRQDKGRRKVGTNIYKPYYEQLVPGKKGY